MFARKLSSVLFISVLHTVSVAQAAENLPRVDTAYKVQAGDILDISVWNEKNLQQEVLVRPDGGFSFPLVGSLSSQNKTVEALQKEISQKLQKYIPDPSVSVALKQINGNKIYVLGKVNRPGEFLLAQDTDVMQALAKAGGMSTFADVNSIKILRRADGKQVTYDFRYGDIEKGKALEQNIQLLSGDVVVVP